MRNLIGDEEEGTITRFTEDAEQHRFAYLTTIGRVSGKPHRVEIWFVIIDGDAWVNSGGGHRSDWVKNLMADRRLEVEIGANRWAAVATFHDDASEHPARERLAARYQGWEPGQPLSSWATSSLLIQLGIDGDG